MINGIDISDFQPDVDWAAVKQSGQVQFAYSKASEGNVYVAKTFIPNHDGCKANGIPFGPYHYFRPYIDPVEQAHFFLAAINGYQGQLLPMVDVETTDTYSAQSIIVSLAKFNETVEAKLDGKRIIIYASSGFWEGSMAGTDAFAGHPYWIAQYNSDAAPTLPQGFSSWVVWQHANNGSIPGIEGNVDLDVLNGDDLGIIRL